MVGVCGFGQPSTTRAAPSHSTWRSTLTRTLESIMTCRILPRLMVRRLAGSALVIIGASTITACSDDDRREIRTYRDSGSVCISPSGATATAVVRVRFDACLSPGCDEPRSTTCTALVSDGRIDIHSRLEVLGAAKGTVCPLGCSTDDGVYATCELETSTSGTYQVVHGDETGTAVLPLTGPIQPIGEQEVCPP